MTTRTNTDTTHRAWIGCLACYNNARLVGEWIEAETADEVTLADVHGGARRVRSGCDELWVMDHENIPALGEMSPSEAAEWARVLLSVLKHQRDALCDWTASGSYVAEGTGDLPSVPNFEERFCGTWGSFRTTPRLTPRSSASSLKTHRKSLCATSTGLPGPATSNTTTRLSEPTRSPCTSSGTCEGNEHER